ncbi:unnamed protein product [Rhizophagus irregularis]|nr:unnamed protein product [Rhizophagus irregularis]
MKLLNISILLFFVIQFLTNNVYSIKDSACGSANDPCLLANSTLKPCHGSIISVPPEALDGTIDFQYQIYDGYLFDCACNVPFYNLLARCTTCFEGLGTSITVESLDSFKVTCGKYFGKAPPPISTTSTLPSQTSSPLPPPPLPSIPPQGQPLPPLPSPLPKPTETPKPIPNQPLFCNCINANLSLISCDGRIDEPDHVLSGTYPRTFKIDDPKLAPCQCNMEYYNDLKECIECYSSPKNKIFVEPLSKYEQTCQQLGVPFGTKPPPLFGKIGNGKSGISLIHPDPDRLGNSIILLTSLIIFVIYLV